MSSRHPSSQRIPLLRAGSVLALLLLAGLPAAASEHELCFGETPTIVGTSAPDELTGTEGRDVIIGRAGDDMIDSLGGPDLVCGGLGWDFIETGRGDDRVKGEFGDEVVFGGAGNDYVDTGAGEVEALFGGPGADEMHGGPGDFDSLIGGSGNDVLDGGPGLDTAEYWDSDAGIEADLRTDSATGYGDDDLIDIEGVIGSDFADVLLGDDGVNLLRGDEGDDHLESFGSGDHLEGNGGVDHVDGGEDADIVSYDDAPEPVSVDLSTGSSTGWGDDTLVSIEGAFGSLFNDRLVGDEQSNFLRPDFGDDEILGGRGTDLLAFYDSFEPVVVDLEAGTALGWGADTFSGMEDAIGSGFADELRGDRQPNWINGGSGRDSIFGLGRDDTLIGWFGIDTIDGGRGSDACDGETEISCESDPAAFEAGGNATSWDDLDLPATLSRTARPELAP